MYWLSTDPTYKEWKPGNSSRMVSSSFAARILPTRNGNRARRRMPHPRNTGTDPTYKEWKPLRCATSVSMLLRHGSYLQGMETGAWRMTDPENCDSARILPTRNGNSTPFILLNFSSMGHGSYLQGMETEECRERGV